MSRHRSHRRPRGREGVPSGRRARAGAGAPRAALRLLGWGAAAGTVAATYMIFEAQWVKCRQAVLSVPGLPPEWSGLSILHLSDVHAGVFRTNDRSLEKVVRWAAPLAPDLVFLTGDVIGDPARSGTCLDMLARLRPALGIFAVTGNHEYGMGKSPTGASAKYERPLGADGGTLPRDHCVALPPRGSSRVVLCGADYPSGGFGFS